MVYLTQYTVQDLIYAGPEVFAESFEEARDIILFHPLQNLLTGFRIVGKKVEYD